MKSFASISRTRRARAGSVAVAAASMGLLVAFASSAQAATTAPGLGTADSFAVLAGAVVTNTGPTTISGDLGTFPTTNVTGTGSLVFASGVNHAGDAVTQGAKTDLVTAYNAAASAGPTSPIVADLTGLTLTPGVYNSASSIGLTGQVTLDAGGDPNAVFIFQAGSTLVTESGSVVSLTNGAQACNVFWQVGSSATIGTGSTFRGTIMAMDSVTLTTGATVEGRALARNGAVTLDTNTITRPTCAAVVTPQAAAQVRRPRGAVSTGDGSMSSSTNNTPILLAGVLGVVGLGGAAVIAVRRRRLGV
jgi:hypothetical protein